MIVYTVVGQGQYVDLKDDLALQKESPWSMYVNLTNRCTCSCTFCLRSMKKMAEDETLWLKQEPTVDEVKKELDGAPWDRINEVVFCGFGEPTERLEDLKTLLAYVKEKHPTVKTRLNTNGLSDFGLRPADGTGLWRRHPRYHFHQHERVQQRTVSRTDAEQIRPAVLRCHAELCRQLQTVREKRRPHRCR